LQNPELRFKITWISYAMTRVAQGRLNISAQWFVSFYTLIVSK
jgi:hypothetical protein